jgi:hypothetical protein
LTHFISGRWIVVLARSETSIYNPPVESAEANRLIDGYLRHLANVGVVPMPTTEQELIEAQELARLALQSYNSFWAWEELRDLVAADTESAWRLLLQIIAKAPENLLYIVGAGPLEDLIRHAHERLAERVVKELNSNGRFLKAFRSVYLFEVPEPIWRAFNDAMVAAGVPASELTAWS